MKKTLSIILSFVMLVTSIVCIFTNGFVASATVGYSEDFESYTVGTDMAADDALAYSDYDAGENKYFKGTPGSNGWMIPNGNLLVSDVMATSEGGKSMAITGWNSGYKEISVQPGKIYTLTLKYYASAVKDKDFAIYDVSNVTEDGYSFKAYTSFEPVKAANRVQLYDKTLLNTLAYERNRSYSANVWNTYTATFITTEGMSKILIGCSYEGASSNGDVMYVDDISLTYVKYEPDAIFADGNFELATAANPSKTISHKEQSLRVHSYKNNKQPIMENGWVGSHYGSANVVLANTTYTPSSGSFTTPAAQDGVHMIRLSTGWQTVAKVVNVEAGKDYALSYWYYADNADAGFMSSMDFAIGLDANATTVTIPVTKWEADGVTIKDCGGDILYDGTDGQTKIAYTPKSGDNKNAVGVWTKRTLYFNSGTFTKIAIPFYHKNNNVYIDNVSIIEQKQISVNVVVTGKDNKDAGSASAVLTDENKFLYTAIANKNSEFLGWYDGETLKSTNASFEMDFASAKNLTAKFNCLYKNEFKDGYIDNLNVGKHIVEGQEITSVADSGKYTMTSIPNADGWMTATNNSNSVYVVEKATASNPYNKAIEVKQWTKLAKIIEVKPNHRYTFTYDYYLPTNAQFGNFNIYDASNITDNKYMGNDGINGTLSDRFMWDNSSLQNLPEIGNNFHRVAIASGADTHDQWKTRTLTFETGENITRILICWAPESNIEPKQPMYIDNLELTSELIPEVKVTITGVDQNAGGAVARLNEDGDKIDFIATAYKNAVFSGWYRNNELVSKDANYSEAYNGSYEIIEARFESVYVNEFTGDSGFENTPFNENLLTGLKITSSSQQVNGVWKYKYEANPNANGYLSQVSTSTALVVEQANAFNPYNKALAVSKWSRFGRVIEVKPNHKYTFTYDYYLPNGAKLGDFNIYNVSSVNNNTYIGRDDIYEAGITVTENNTFLFRDSENNKFPELGNNYFRGADKAADYADAAGNPVDSHENWITRTATFETDANTTKILIAFKPEGDKPLILDNLTLTSLFIPPVDVTITGEDDSSSASAYAVVNDEKTEIKFVAKNFPNSEFLGWYKEGALVSTDVVYTVSYNGDYTSYEKMEARFNCLYINEFKDGYIDNLETGTAINNGQTVTELAKESYEQNGEIRWRYNKQATPNENGWMTSGGSSVLVTELTDENGDINKVLTVGAWNKLAKVLEVKPNHKYTFSYDYYLPNGAEFGHFNILNVSSVTDNAYVGVYDVNCPYETGAKKKYAWYDSSLNTFSQIGDNYKNSSGRADNGVPGDEDYIDSHETWITKTFTFETGSDITKILITWNPESNVKEGDDNDIEEPMYIDNLTLTSEFVPYVNVGYYEDVVSGEGDDLKIETLPTTNISGGANARLNDAKDTIVYVADAYANGEFLGWYKNDVLVSADAIYSEAYDGNVDGYVALEARFKTIYKNEFLGDTGFENTTVGTDITAEALSEDQKNLTQRIVVGYDSSDPDAEYRRNIANEILLKAGFKSKISSTKIGDINYLTVIITPADDDTKNAALSTLSVVQTDIPVEYYSSEAANDKVILGYEKSQNASKAQAAIAVRDLALKGIDAEVIEISFKAAEDESAKVYYAVALKAIPEGKELEACKDEALAALTGVSCDLPEKYDKYEYLYTYHSTPSADGWVKHGTEARSVVELATADNPYNRAMRIPAWGKTAKVLTVSKNTEYTLSFDFFSPLMLEFGTVAVYDITNLSKEEFCARDDVNGMINLFKDTENNEFSTLAYNRNAGPAHAINPELHDKWDKFSATFKTKVTTEKVLVVWYPEGKGALYVDNISLAGAELSYPITPKASADQAEWGGVYPDTNYIPVGQDEATLTFMASPTAGYEFEKWELNGVAVEGKAGTNPVYVGTFKKDTVLTPKFKAVNGGNIVKNSGAEQLSVNTNMLDNKNDPTIPGSWFAVWSTDGSDGNGYSAKHLEQKEDGTPQAPQKFWTLASVTNEEARSGNNSYKFESMSYQILGRDITGLQANKRYLLSFWVKFTSESSYLNFVSVTPKAIKDEQWKNGECNSSNLHTHGVGGKAIATINTSEKTLKLDGSAQGWQKVSIAFTTPKDTTAVALTMQMIDPKGKAKALYVDDIGIEEIAATTKLVNATATFDIGGTAQTSAGNGFVKQGELTMFHAIPHSPITFDGWYEPGKDSKAVSTKQYYTFELKQDTSLVAKFNAIEVALQSYELGGYATVDKTGVFPKGTEVTFTAKAYENNKFAGWYDANTDKLVSNEPVYKDVHDKSVILVAKFSGYNKPAREVLGLEGFENIANNTNIKETWMKGEYVDSIIDYQIYANGSNDNAWTTFTVNGKRAYEGTKALYCLNRWRFTRLELTGLNKNTTYKISFKYHMQEEDEAAKMYTYVGPTGVEVPDETQSKDLMYIYDETGLGGGRGWDTYELYFNSGELTTLEFGIKFEASTPPFSKGEAHKNPWGTDQSNMYIDNLELWEYSANEEIVSAGFDKDNTAWLSTGNKTTFENKVANIPANSTTYQYVKVAPFTQYLFTFEANANDLAAGVVGVEYNTVNSISKISSISGYDVSNSGMNKYTVAFTTGNEEAAILAFTNNGSATAKIDNVALTVDNVGYSEGVIEKVDFDSERFAINNFFIDPTPVMDTKNDANILDCANEHPFQNKGFEIYTATSSNDKNVLSGNSSLKILPQADEAAAHKLWQTWMNFPTKKLNGNYLITFNYRFENADGGAIYLAGDARDVYTQEHTIYAHDDKWHTAYFSIDNTEGLIFLKAAIGTIAGKAGSAIYVDDVTFQLHPSMITEATTRYTYCENLYNKVENNNFEDKITSADWSGMPSEYTIASGNAFTEDKYLKAGVSSKVYTKVVEVDPSQAYYVGVSLRGATGTKGTFNLMSTNTSGNNILFTDADKTVNSTFTYNGSGDWERYGFKFVTPSNGKLSIVIDTRNGALDIDNIMIFPIKFKYTYDPNDYYDYKPYDYSDMSNVIINGGVGKQPYYDGDLKVGRDKDPYAAKGNALVYNPTHTENNVVNLLVLTLSMLASLAAVAYLIVKNKKKEVK